MRLPGTRTPDDDERGCEVLMKMKGNYASVLKVVRDMISDGRTPLVQNPHLQQDYKDQWRDMVVESLNAAIDCLEKSD